MDCCFLFKDAATTKIYTLSLHDALPISLRFTSLMDCCKNARCPICSTCAGHFRLTEISAAAPASRRCCCRASRPKPEDGRSEEHTSELQSRRDLVCRLLLEKKKQVEEQL